MSEDEQNSVSERPIWITLIICITILFLSIPTCSMYKSNKMSSLIENGADPIAVACAFASSQDRLEASCAIRAMKVQK